MTLFVRLGRPVAGTVTLAALTLSLLAMTFSFSSPASAQASAPGAASCATAVTSAPTGPATVAAVSTPYGRVLVIGAGEYAGCSLYLLTSDQIQVLTSGAVPFACSDNPNPTSQSCDGALWPALLTQGAPIAGPGVNPALLGTVTRTDILSGLSVQQVTYAGLPLYRFFMDETAGETDGANQFDPVTTPHGVWYLVEASRGHPAPGVAQLQLETAPIGDSGEDETVLAVSMGGLSFPVYTLSERGLESGRRGGIGCRGTCAAVPWPPVLTSSRPKAGPGVEQGALGTIVRPDGTEQVTYKGRPLYLFYADAYIPGFLPFSNGGTPTINGSGVSTPWGTFNAIRIQ